MIWRFLVQSRVAAYDSTLSSVGLEKTIHDKDLVIIVKFRQCRLDVNCATMADWLRRLTWNQMGSSRVGSSPTRSVRALHSQILYYWWSSRQTILGNGFIIFQRFAGVWDWQIWSPELVSSRDSSVGRASDWRSEGSWFNPGSRHMIQHLAV